MKRVAIDTVFLNNRYSGISIVWYDILSNLEADGYEVILFKRQDSYIPDKILKKYTVVELRKFEYRDLEVDVDYLDDWCELYNIDLFISTYYTFTRKVPCALYVHDMIPNIFQYSVENNLMWKQRDMCFSNAEYFICVSDNTKKDLKRFHPELDESKIFINYNSINFDKFQEKDDSIIKKLDITKPYFLTIASNMDYYKNVQLVKDMFDRYPIVFEKFDFVFLSNKFSDAYPIKWAKGVNDSELSSLYSNALGMIYPSLYEGFGLPILESFYHRTNALTCWNSSLKEVGGDCCVYVCEDDPVDLYYKLFDVQKGKYKDLIQCGYDRCNQYTVNKQVDKFNGIINKVMSDG